jgi:hypothetical protein
MAPQWPPANAPSPPPTLTFRIVRALWNLFAFSYGLTVVLGFIIRSRWMSSSFRIMTRNDKQQLADGNQSANPAVPNTLIFT